MTRDYSKFALFASANKASHQSEKMHPPYFCPLTAPIGLSGAFVFCAPERAESIADTEVLDFRRDI